MTNIKRAAELLDGTVLTPRERFSLNEAIGQRTVEKGFVSAPQIRAGRLEDSVGGGISQVATTIYNAAFFAGLRIDEHQAHQFYISRYPMGREATVSWGGPEMICTNDWPVGVLIRSCGPTRSITVRLYSSKLGRRVETVTYEPYGYRAPTTNVSRNTRSLPASASCSRRAPRGSRWSTRVRCSAGRSGSATSATAGATSRERLRRGGAAEEAQEEAEGEAGSAPADRRSSRRPDVPRCPPGRHRLAAVASSRDGGGLAPEPSLPGKRPRPHASGASDGRWMPWLLGRQSPAAARAMSPRYRIPYHEMWATAA